MWVSFLKLIVVFPIIILLLLYLLQSMKKYIQPQSVNKSMQIIQQIKLSPKTNLSIVKVGTQYLVIACNDEHIELITTLSNEEAQEIEKYKEQLSPEFFQAERLNKKLEQWKGRWKK